MYTAVIVISSQLFVFFSSSLVIFLCFSCDFLFFFFSLFFFFLYFHSSHPLTASGLAGPFFRDVKVGIISNMLLILLTNKWLSEVTWCYSRRCQLRGFFSFISSLSGLFLLLLARSRCPATARLQSLSRGISSYSLLIILLLLLLLLLLVTKYPFSLCSSLSSSPVMSSAASIFASLTLPLLSASSFSFLLPPPLTRC